MYNYKSLFYIFGLYFICIFKIQCIFVDLVLLQTILIVCLLICWSCVIANKWSQKNESNGNKYRNKGTNKINSTNFKSSKIMCATARESTEL